jgi:hypothetical protein
MSEQNVGCGMMQTRHSTVLVDYTGNLLRSIKVTVRKKA